MDVVENKDTSEGVTWPSVTTGVAQLPVAHVHIQGNPEGVKWPSVTSGNHVTTTKKKKCGKSRACAEHTSGQGHFRTGPLPVTWLCHFRSKGPTRADITQLPVAHSILPTKVTSGQGLFRSRDWCYFRSHDFRLLLIAPPQILTELYPYTTGVLSYSEIYIGKGSLGYFSFCFLFYYAPRRKVEWHINLPMSTRSSGRLTSSTVFDLRKVCLTNTMLGLQFWGQIDFSTILSYALLGFLL